MPRVETFNSAQTFSSPAPIGEPDLIPFNRRTFVRNIVPSTYPDGVRAMMDWSAKGGLWSNINGEKLYWGAPLSELIAADAFVARDVTRLKFEGYIGIYRLPKDYKDIAEVASAIPGRVADLDISDPTKAVITVPISPVIAREPHGVGIRRDQKQSASPANAAPSAPEPPKPEARRPGRPPGTGRKSNEAAANTGTTGAPRAARRSRIPASELVGESTINNTAVQTANINPSDTIDPNAFGEVAAGLVAAATPPAPPTTTRTRHSKLGGGGSRLSRIAANSDEKTPEDDEENAESDE